MLRLLAISILLAGCASKTSVREKITPPPQVACDAQPMSLIPPIPDLSGMAEWGVTVMGLYEQAAERLNATNDCLRKLRGDGVIR